MLYIDAIPIATRTVMKSLFMKKILRREMMNVMKKKLQKNPKYCD